MRLTVLGATKLKDTDWLSKSDPYVIVEYEGEEQRTSVIKSGGKNPRWDETLQFESNNRLGEVTFTIKDKDLIHDDFVGKGSFNLADHPGGAVFTVQVYTKHGREHGKIDFLYALNPNRREEEKEDDTTENENSDSRPGHNEGGLHGGGSHGGGYPPQHGGGFPPQYGGGRPPHGTGGPPRFGGGRPPYGGGPGRW